MTDNHESLRIDAELMPIREISRLTGVNTVTLRAWERRYGLLIPQRTNKGHRLYSRADIDRVKDIQVWLGRGLAISKVKALLASPTFEPCEQLIDSHWLPLSQQMHVAINGFKRKLLQRLIEDVLSLYPIEMVADYLFSLVLLDLQGDEPGMAVRRVFFVNLAMEVILEAQARQRKAATGEQILLLSATESDNSLLAQLFSYSLLINQYQTEYLGYLNLREALLGCQALDAKIVVLIGYGSMNTTELQLHLNGWQEKSTVSLLLLGNITAAYSALGIAPSQGVTLCSNQQQAVTFINQFLKG
jgi:DNA-binding transcriptional MerR regulator